VYRQRLLADAEALATATTRLDEIVLPDPVPDQAAFDEQPRTPAKAAEPEPAASAAAPSAVSAAGMSSPAIRAVEESLASAATPTGSFAKKPVVVAKKASGMGGKKLGGTKITGSAPLSELVEEAAQKGATLEPAPAAPITQGSFVLSTFEPSPSRESIHARGGVGLDDEGQGGTRTKAPAPAMASSGGWQGGSGDNVIIEDSFRPAYLAPSASSSASSKQQDGSDIKAKFGNAKAISSRQVNGDDEADAGAAKGRLGEFTGARSISSAQYFNRVEEPKGDEDFEVSAAEMAQRFAAQAKEDLSLISASLWDKAQVLKEAARTAMQNLGAE
jgi:hypothetical protein